MMSSNGNAALAPVIEDVTPEPGVPNATPVPAIECVAPALVSKPRSEELSALESLQYIINEKQWKVIAASKCSSARKKSCGCLKRVRLFLHATLRNCDVKSKLARTSWLPRCVTCMRTAWPEAETGDRGKDNRTCCRGTPGRGYGCGGSIQCAIFAITTADLCRSDGDGDSEFNVSLLRGTDSAPRRICMLHHCGPATSVLCPTPSPTPRTRNDGCFCRDCFLMVDLGIRSFALPHAVLCLMTVICRVFDEEPH